MSLPHKVSEPSISEVAIPLVKAKISHLNLELFMSLNVYYAINHRVLKII